MSDITDVPDWDEPATLLDLFCRTMGRGWKTVDQWGEKIPDGCVPHGGRLEVWFSGCDPMIFFDHFENQFYLWFPDVDRTPIDVFEMRELIARPEPNEPGQTLRDRLADRILKYRASRARVQGKSRSSR